MKKRSFSYATNLADIHEENLKLDEKNPIVVRHGIIQKTQTVIQPEYHPYLEFAIRFKGEGVWFAEGDKAWRRPYDVYFGAMNQPHGGTIVRGPVEFVTVYFLPGVLSEWGTADEGIRILDRFTANQPLARRLIHPPPALRRRLTFGFQQMVEDFQSQGFGRQLKLRARLILMLVDIIHWEQKEGLLIAEPTKTGEQWQIVVLAMRYIREHFSDPIYAGNIAAALGVNESKLRAAFRETLRMPWVRYLEGYRIYRGALLLKEPGHNVTETAFSVGFGSLSQFCRLFHSLMGASPHSYKAKPVFNIGDFPLESSVREKLQPGAPRSI